MTLEARQFLEEMLRLLRREFFAGRTDKEFFQERAMLIRAITQPADYINKRGARLPASEYRKILGTVIAAVKRHGKWKTMHRFSAYLVVVVQNHMAHHGDEYYDLAKTADGRATGLRRLGAILPEAMRKVRPGGTDQTTAILAEANALARSPGGRIRKQESSEFAGDLFDRCNAPAVTRQKP